MKNKLLLISFFFLCLIIVPKIANAQIRYDITNLRISDETINLSGWGIIQWEDNGKLNSDGIGYAPTYKFEIYSDTGEVIDTTNFHYDTLPNNRNMFSVTCYNSFGSDFNECVSYEQTNLDKRNELIEKLNSNMERYRWFYDNVDFTATLNIKNKLKENQNYYIRMTIELNNGKSETIDKIFVRNDSNVITNTSNNLNLEDFFNSDHDNIVNVVAGSAKTRNYAETGNSSNVGFGSDTCTFKNQIYLVDSYKPIFQKGHSILYLYKLQTNTSSFNDTCTNTLQNLNNVGAYASWLVPSGKSAITLKLKTCDDLDYAVANPGKCCDQYKETCCGNPEFIETLYKNNPNDELFSENYCCSNSNYYIINNEVWENIKLPSFKYYINNKLPEDYLYNNNKNYTGEYINEICKNKIEDDKCQNKEDYSYGNECCLENPEKYPDICKIEDTDSDTCFDSSYFNANKSKCCNDKDSKFFENNRGICCLLEEHKNQNYCNGEDGEEPIVSENPDAACKINSESKFTLKNKKEIYKNEACKIDIVKDNITFSDYSEYVKNLDVVKAGMGFEFNLKITNEFQYKIDLDYMKRYFENNDYNKEEVENILNNCISKLNDLNKNEQDYKNTLINNRQKYSLKKTYPDENVDYYINNNIEKIDEKEEKNQENFNLRYIVGTETCVRYTDNGPLVWSVSDTSCNSLGDTRNVDDYLNFEKNSKQISLTNTFSYSISPGKYYISKLNENDNLYTKENEDIEITIKPNYMGGEKIVTTHTYDEIGYRNFYVTLVNGGITGEVDSKIDDNESFDCQYRLMNQFIGQTEVGIPGDGNPFYYFRQISLTVPFPNRILPPSSNWYGTVGNTNKTKEEVYITDKGDSVYSSPIYSVKLTNANIEDIREYNKNAVSGYLDWTTMECHEFDKEDCTSTFLDTYFSDSDFTKLRQREEN